MNPAPHVWIPKATPAEMQAGLTRDLAEERANQSYDRMLAPACPGCGQGVLDKDFDRHRAEVHGRPRQVVQPYGRPDAREALFTAPTKDCLDQKIVEWRTAHPGVLSEPVGEGRDRDTGLIWVRFLLKPPRRSRA